jgi:hypothetical protein
MVSFYIFQIFSLLSFGVFELLILNGNLCFHLIHILFVSLVALIVFLNILLHVVPYFLLCLSFLEQIVKHLFF